MGMAAILNFTYKYKVQYSTGPQLEPYFAKHKTD